VLAVSFVRRVKFAWVLYRARGSVERRLVWCRWMVPAGGGSLCNSRHMMRCTKGQ
jgi:hypothetical protein